MPKKHSRRKTSKVKKGGYYSFSGDVGVPGGANWTRHSELGDAAVSSRGNNAQYGRGRKRKAKRRKTMRGGNSFGEVTASFRGEGSRGLANFAGISPNKPGFPTQGGFNNFGAQPGSGFGSFITAGK